MLPPGSEHFLVAEFPPYKNRFITRNFAILYDKLADAVEEINSIFSMEVQRSANGKRFNIKSVFSDDCGLHACFVNGNFRYLLRHQNHVHEHSTSLVRMHRFLLLEFLLNLANDCGHLHRCNHCSGR